MRWSLVALAALAIAGGYAVSRGVGAESAQLAIAQYLSSLPAISHKVPGPFGLDEKPAIFRMTILPPEKASQRD
jgi:hypothetical protein